MKSRYLCAVDGREFEELPVELSSLPWMDPGTAARLYATDLCNGDSDWYSHFDGGARVRVRDEDTGSETWWVVSVESVPSWHVHRHPEAGPVDQTTDGTSVAEGGE